MQKLDEAGNGRIKIGLCGFTVSTAAYARRFPVVEVQQTFYQPPTASTMLRWRSIMPTGFEFTIKAWQLITHTYNSSTYRRLKRPLSEAERHEVGAFQATNIVDAAWATTVDCAQALGATAILLQCPASFRPTPAHTANLRGFVARVQRPPGVRLLWEPRGPWPDQLVRELCADLDLVHVVDPFVNRSVTEGFTYWRLHGTTGARHVYTDDELKQLVRWLPESGETYVMFNNMPRAEDSRRFEELVKGGDEGRRLLPPLA